MKSLRSVFVILIAVPLYAIENSSDSLWRPDPKLKTYEVVVGESFDWQKQALDWPKDQDEYFPIRVIEKPHNIRMKFGEKFFTLYSHITAIEQENGIISEVTMYPLRKQMNYYDAVEEYAKILDFIGLAQTTKGQKSIKSYREGFASTNFPRFELSRQIYLEPSVPTRNGQFPTPIDAQFAVKLEVIKSDVFDRYLKK